MVHSQVAIYFFEFVCICYVEGRYFYAKLVAEESGEIMRAPMREVSEAALCPPFRPNYSIKGKFNNLSTVA